MRKGKRMSIGLGLTMAALAFWLTGLGTAYAAPLPGGTLDPLTIPKYVTPLVIPPVMNSTGANQYDISVKQFKQQILPGGIWNTINGRADAFPATTVWSYGPTADPEPTGGIAPAANSQYNYPAYTIETSSGTPVDVRWRNGLTAGFGASNQALPHLLPVDQTLHWANPAMLPCMDPGMTTDCRPDPAALPDPTVLLQSYTGPVPMVVHVHGAEVEGVSDGYPEAWWLPAGVNTTFASHGTLFDDTTGLNPGNLGYADFHYVNGQPATTLWYHDHTLGMTRLNVYAGPAGFWLIRGGAFDGGTVQGGPAAVLPGPAPIAGQGVLDLNVPLASNPSSIRRTIREIPIAIQARSFNADGSLFYPASRTFFDAYPGPYTGSNPISTDIAPIWNPEAFFNTMVINGVSWPTMEVAPALYRLRLLNGNNSRFLNLALFQVVSEKVNVKKGGPNAGVIQQVTKYGAELPLYQIGAEQGFLPQVVQVQTGFATPLPGNGTQPALVAAPDPQQALLMGLAERADVIVDFRGLPNGTRIRMINTGPDAPFGGFPDVPADPSSTGQVMEFVVNATAANAGGPFGASPTDPVLADGVTANPNAATSPLSLVPNDEGPNVLPLTTTRLVSLNEEMSGQVCVKINPAGKVTVLQPPLSAPVPPADITAYCAALGGVPMAPIAALVGIVDNTNPALPLGIPLKWTDTTGTSTPTDVTLPGLGVVQVPVTENPTAGDTEAWDIYNFTVDAHPIHLHLVRFQVISRTPIPGVVGAVGGILQPWETGYKDTVIAYPGQITRVKATFPTAGLYVWHCHIVEHEDNEMMRPYVVSAAAP
jgi:spore coat protein A